MGSNETWLMLEHGTQHWPGSVPKDTGCEAGAGHGHSRAGGRGLNEQVSLFCCPLGMCKENEESILVLLRLSTTQDSGAGKKNMGVWAIFKPIWEKP